MKMLESICLLLSVIVVVEITGYFWHRYFSHIGYLGNTIRKAHYMHHEIHYPYTNMESIKYKVLGLIEGDAWPWVILMSLLIGTIFTIFKLGYISLTNSILMSGLVVLDVYFNSYIHVSYHEKDHWLNKYQWYRQNKHYHKLHHYYNCNYGISNFSTDYLFGSLVTQFDSNRKKENLFHGFS
jgi:sterol desaturase/sphingolipid hydroxylase (fatty acid hydroxylase superfamily)